MGIRLGIDVGGTFTDFIEIGEGDALRILKVPSVPANPAEGVLAGMMQLSEAHGELPLYLDELELIVHGTTIATNAILTRRYARTGYLTTTGFRDILNSRRGIKRNAFTAKEAPPEPIVPQYLVRTAAGRIDKAGVEIEPLSEQDVRAAAAHFRAEQVDAVAVCLMFSFLNPAHERAAKEILEAELPGVYVTLSSEVLPKARLYERGSTTVFNACIGPLLRRYVDALLTRLRDMGFRGQFLTMQSNGGVMSPEVVKDFAANTLLSGPASGPVAGVFFARGYVLRNLITIDMGGTSLDACLVRDGQAAITDRTEVAEYALALPTLDINAIGAGGGSIASVAGGMLQVGPDSAGADPGPAAYGLGGERPTVTDANLVLGFLDPANFLGGRKHLNVGAAERAIARHIGEPLRLAPIEAASGIVRVIDGRMANGVRAVSVARGFDPREACLVAAGGAGPLHACGIAEELEMDLILVPSGSSVFCAAGMLASDLRQDVVHHAAIRLGGEAVPAINRLARELAMRGRSILTRQHVPDENRRLEFSCDMLFEGQFNTIETRQPVLDGGDIGEDGIAILREAFEAAHERIYGYMLAGEPVEIRSMRLAAIGRTSYLRFPRLEPGGGDAGAALKSRRRAWFDGAFAEVSVYDGGRLRAGHVLAGPALIDHPTTTIKLAPGWQARVDEIGNLLIWRAGAELAAVLARLSPQSQGITGHV
jgi:N-methylhydantoinase A